MAAVSVFVDDAIRGRLPLVCATTGQPADLVVRMRQPVGGGMPGAAWLLVFLGPVGIVALVVVALVCRAPEYLTVRVPQTEAAYQRERLLGRLRSGACVLGVATLAYGIVRPGLFPVMWLVLGVGFLLAGMGLHAMVYFRTVGVGLDASRRWVTLTGVHPEFVRAVERQDASGGRLTAADR